MADPLYRFHFLRTDIDTTGYYHPRWDKAVAVTVIASSETAALAEATRLSDKEMRRPFRPGFLLQRIEAIDPGESTVPSDTEEPA